MATTPNYNFIMPDPTDFVTDLPADFEIFGDEVDLRIKALNPETTAGDLAYRGATANAKERLPIGTAGQVLAVNSGATAPEWVTSSSGALTLLETITFAGASSYTTSTFATGYQEIHIYIDNFQLSTDLAKTLLRLNGDTGTNYANIQYNTEFTTSFGSTSMTLSTNADDTVHKNTSFIKIMNPESTTSLKVIQTLTFMITDNGTTPGGVNNFKGYNNTSAVTTATVLASTGNLDAGTMKVYGYK